MVWSVSMADLSEEGPCEEARVSRTARYRKVTKPLLERRRRARINRCLDELKDLMVGALEVERENISKLEKADILELTVRHLSKLREPRDPRAEAERFQAGFGHCAAEAYHFILSSPGVDSHITQQLVRHLSSQMNENQFGVPLAIQQPFSSPAPSISPSSSVHSAYSPNYQLESKQSSPSISPVGHGGRNDPQWKEDLPRVPVERSLSCDVSQFNPPIRRPNEPVSGLLMTVNTDPPVAPRTHTIHPGDKHYGRYHTHEMRREADVRDGYNSDPNVERKNEILKKIREHIMERQLKEPDTSSHCQRNEMQDNYQVKPPRNLPDEYRSHKQVNYTPPEHGKSGNFNSLPNSQKTTVKEEAINLTSSETSRTNDVTEIPRRSPEVVIRLKRQQTDYKSIHPKKVIIRDPSKMLIDLQPTSSFEGNSKIFVEQSNRSPEHAMVVVADSSNQKNGLCPTEKISADKNGYSREGFQRYKNHNFNLEKEQYFQDQDSDQDDMWRPW